MPGKSLFERGFKTIAEQKSILIREELSISKFKPLDAFKLAEHKQIPIFSVDDVFAENKTHPSYAFMSNPGKFNALWMPNEDGDKIIIHNSNHSPYRQQSNLMHELAHIILEHEMPDDIAQLCKLYNLHYYNKKDEQEAKYLGACLQIPKPGLLWAIKENWTIDQISQFFTASPEMVNYRLNSIGARKMR